MSDFELKIGSNLKVSHEPFVALDELDVFIFAFRPDGTEMTDEHDVFCTELGSQIEVLKGMESPFMKQLYWQLLAVETVSCGPKQENDDHSFNSNFESIFDVNEIRSRREACEQMKEHMSKIDPGFVREGPPPGHEDLPPPVPMPMFDVPIQNLDPCFDPCSEECLDIVEPKYDAEIWFPVKF